MKVYDFMHYKRKKENLDRVKKIHDELYKSARGDAVDIELVKTTFKEWILEENDLHLQRRIL